MSEICPSSSHQLAAAALAFHRARRKFSNPPEVPSPTKVTQKSLSSQNNEGSCKGMITTRTGVTGAATRTLDKTENNPSKLKVSRDCCCLRNCKSAGDEHSFDEDKSNQHLAAVHALGDSIVVGVSKMKNVTDNVDALKETDKNQIYEFNYSLHYNPLHYDKRKAKVSSATKRSSRNNERPSNLGEQSSINSKSVDLSGESIDLLYKSATRNDDRAPDFSTKLHEWERRTRDGLLMKIQRFSPSKLQQESQPQQQQQFINNREDARARPTECHLYHRRNYCRRHRRQTDSIDPASPEAHSHKKSQCGHQRNLDKLNNDKSQEPQLFCKRCNAIRAMNLRMPDTCTGDTDEAGSKYGAEELVKGKVGLIKHKDSLDILVEKFKSRKILGESKSKGKKVIRSWMKIDESLSCEKIPDQLTSDDPTKELSCTDHRASRTCWTHAESSLSRPNKLSGRFGPNNFRS